MILPYLKFYSEYREIGGSPSKRLVLFLRLPFWQQLTLPQTNIAPESRPSQKETHLPTIHFQVQLVSFRGGVLLCFFFRSAKTSKRNPLLGGGVFGGRLGWSCTKVFFRRGPKTTSTKIVFSKIYECCPKLSRSLSTGDCLISLYQWEKSSSLVLLRDLFSNLHYPVN